MSPDLALLLGSQESCSFLLGVPEASSDLLDIKFDRYEQLQELVTECLQKLGQIVHGDCFYPLILLFKGYICFSFTLISLSRFQKKYLMVSLLKLYNDVMMFV